ncbi:hypothetical protein ABIB94_007477 [Bradyrhizobium sp. JR7.2]|uniref:hypothetical protein n=1 Tax=Bradyrhizobium TaxID=374 RepID=UPI0024B2116B|nr:hypothetical protein [Bradyrhizobium barranii]WFU00201.1 hypothetical protein QA633_48735 [Bradyrhizobium barranii]
MGLLSSIELPHWLMIAGIILAIVGVFGLVITRNKHAKSDAPGLLPEISPPSQLDSSPHKDNE